MNMSPMRRRRVLIFPAGTEIALEILASLRQVRGMELFAAGQDVSTHARFAFNNYYELPHVSAPNWLQKTQELCNQLRIDCIFPAHDDAVVALARNQSSLPTVIVPSTTTCEITRSKRATYEALADVVSVPKIYSSQDEIKLFPVFIKPDRGQGSSGAQEITSAEHLSYAASVIDDPIICELLPGEEFTVDCFSSVKQGLLFAGARQRVRTRSGISVNTRRVNLEEAWQIASAINGALSMRGGWFFQLKRRDSGELVLLEVAPRVAGAMALHRAAGVNFPMLSILERDGCELKIMVGEHPQEMDRCLLARYRHELHFRTLYLDLDDTLIVSGRVNVDVVRLIYASINAGRRVVLLTRHAGNLKMTLAKHRIAELFDRVVHVRNGEPKSEYIEDQDSIYVDDSFAERAEVALHCNISTFDCSMLEFLINQAESMTQVDQAEGKNR